MKKRIEQKVVDELLKRKKRIAVAESCTGGLLLSKLTRIEGASGCLDFGIVSYSNWVKSLYLSVPPLILRKYGAVSRQTAFYMAKNVKKRGNADIGVSITGVAGPGGGTDKKPVGRVYIAVSAEDRDIVWVKELTIKNKKREYIQNYSARYALCMILNILNRI